jgi:Arc/MetJ-type ribon-helix-helix transcriptional regulator
MNITLTPALRRFVDEQVESGRYLDASEVVRAALRHWEAQTAYPNLGAMGDGDIMALAFIVMMEAAKSAREDLKAIMDGVKAINKAKQGWRDVMDMVNRDAAANAGCRTEGQALEFSRGVGTERGYHRVRLPVLDPDAPGGVRYEQADLHSGKIVRVEDLQTILSDVKGKLDSLSELGEMESLRLQMAMDRLSRLMSTLSNLLKKASETDAGLTQNIK